MCPLSSVVERLAVNQEVAGSIPAAGDALQAQSQCSTVQWVFAVYISSRNA